jgi:poly-gamma-glutamate capsule biosynthesis protein CapA/YwtB (metallophosphatase superfamily)
MPHWNYQWVDYPSPFDWGNGHKIINAGADIIIGAHPHILQGIEVYKGKYIFHSLGNFLFERTKYSKESEKLGKTLILNLTIKPDFSYETIEHFIHSDGLSLNILNDKEIAKVVTHLKNISSPLTNRKELSRLFYKNSIIIDKNTNFVFKEMKKAHGWGSVIKDLMRANRQDIKKRAFSIYVKYFAK